MTDVPDVEKLVERITKARQEFWSHTRLEVLADAERAIKEMETRRIQSEQRRQQDEAEVKRLSAQLAEANTALKIERNAGDHFEASCDEWRERATAAESTLAETRKRLAAAVAVIEPFARYAEAHDGPDGLQPDLGDDHVWLRPSPDYPAITTGHFRRAREWRKNDAE